MHIKGSTPEHLLAFAGKDCTQEFSNYLLSIRVSVCIYLFSGHSFIFEHSRIIESTFYWILQGSSTCIPQMICLIIEIILSQLHHFL